MSAAAATTDTARMIRELEAEFERNAGALDAPALTHAFYAEDAQLLPPDSPIVKGAAAIRDFWTAFFTGKPTEIKMDTLEVVESAGLAYSIGAYRYTQDSVRHEGKYTVLYRKDDSGTYRCIVDSFSDNA